MSLLDGYIADKELLRLIRQLVISFEAGPGRGLPLGNLTSQLLVNVYMNEFDQYVKHGLRVKHYVRYADDFVLLSRDRVELVEQLELIRYFLSDRLALDLHPHKVSISTLASGVDFLGWVHFPGHRVLRKTTQGRMMRNLARGATAEIEAAYLGMLIHGNGYTLSQEAANAAWLWQQE
ncbi:MAG: hypothetical protein NVSMB39_4850 [Candidatus Saccharimonadales bacterium]